MLQSHHFDHPDPIMMPYNMEYALPSHAYHTELGNNDLYAMHMAAAASGHDPATAAAVANHGLESMTAESSLSHVVNLQNGTLGQSIVGLQTVPKVKRQDRENLWAGNNPYLHTAQYY